MTEKNKDSGEYQRIDPEDFYNYEEGFVKKGGGGGSGGKGKKTLKALKKEQQIQSREKRKLEVENSLVQILTGFPPEENRDLERKRLDRYIGWIMANIKELAPLDPSDFEMTFSKSGGPGGQNVNKRETRVILVHIPTFLQVESDQFRSQLQNRNSAMDLLQLRLQDHLNAWKEYLTPNQIVDVELIKFLLEKEK